MFKVIFTILNVKKLHKDHKTLLKKTTPLTYYRYQDSTFETFIKNNCTLHAIKLHFSFQQIEPINWRGCKNVTTTSVSKVLCGLNPKVNGLYVKKKSIFGL